MRRHGFTLVEITITIVIIAILAGISLPRLTIVIERQRSVEGVNILTAIRGAQERWRLENNAYTNNINNLDITVPASANFQPPIANNIATGNCPTFSLGTINRPGLYTLEICDAGGVQCTDTQPGICQKMGY